ncbi:MAG: DUF3016 domain-containing protein [Proteobacteria bacterium]|nr:DUF3016 domain-containing protein [Pseudomonadota bacterium]
MRIAAIALALLAGGAAAQAAGVVEVGFKPADQYVDAGRGIDGQRTLEQLGAYFKSLGARLPDGRTLKIDVQELDLAGEQRPMRRTDDLRVMRGGADWPAMTLRWTLSEGERTLQSGEERISDMNYLMHSMRGDNDPLTYEKRMIEQWFEQRFAPPKP